MPRYRFQWEAVPAPVLRRLARDFELVGEPAEALAAAYGKRPREEFVRDAWPSLREVWLRRDTLARRVVVEQLRERALGDLELPIRNREQQQAYLATCRNAQSLRAIVLGAFTALGDPAQSGGPRRREPQLTPDYVVARSARFEAAETDFDRDLENAWFTFEQCYAEALASYDLGAIDILTPAFTSSAGRHISAAFCVPEDLARASVVSVASSHADPLPAQLTLGQHDAMLALGWDTAPCFNTAVGGDPAWMYLVDTDSWDTAHQEPGRLADLVVRTLREVFAVVHPCFLLTDGFGDEANESGSDVESADDPTVQVQAGSESVIAYRLPDVEPLKLLVNATLSPLLDGQPIRDEDDDVVFLINEFPCYVHEWECATKVLISVGVLREVPATAAVVRELNQLNRQFGPIQLTLSGGGTVSATMHVSAWPFLPAHLLDAIDDLKNFLANAELLHESLGGTRYDY